jgi:glycosyltransferase involved in cell wall biosynthesis
VRSSIPMVSIVIPNYNCGEFLIECIQSAINQTYPNTEIIVIDDGSTDDSVEILSLYKEQVALIKTSNKGAAAARNLGISIAKGEFIAFLDSDDWWTADKISRQVVKMTQDNCDLVYCSGIEVIQGKSEVKTNLAEYEGDCYPLFKKFPTKAIIVYGCSGAVIRSSNIEISGNFDESFGGAAEDWDFFRRYCKEAKVGFISDPLLSYRRHAASVTHRPVSDWYYGNMRAVRNLISEDLNIKFIESRIIWTKFQLVAMKTFVNAKDLKLCLRAIVALFEPVYSGKNFRIFVQAGNPANPPKPRK